MELEKLATEARAKIIWGESLERVRQYLQTNGVGEKQASALLATFQEERQAAIRSTGKKKTILGTAALGGATLSWYLLLWLGFSFNHQAGKLFTIPVALGLFGLWQLYAGLEMLLAPQMEKRDVSHLED